MHSLILEQCISVLHYRNLVASMSFGTGFNDKALVQTSPLAHWSIMGL